MHLIPILGSQFLLQTLPLYFFQTDLRLDVDPPVFSGFLAAAAAFGSAIRRDFTMTDLSLGEIRLHFHHGDQVITVLGTAVHEASGEYKTQKEFELLKHHHDMVTILGKTFHKLFADQIKTWDGQPEVFDRFETTVDLILGSETRFLERDIL